MDYQELIEQVKQWGRDKGIKDPVAQYAKINEEIGEIARELTRGRLDSPAMVDAIGDSLTTLIIFADIVGVDPLAALSAAYQVYAPRQGKMENGFFIKDESK